jgi:competence protein ComEC
LVSYTLAWLNAFIVWVASLPFTTISHIQMGIVQTAIMYFILASCCWWWFKKSSKALVAALGFSALFFVLRSWQFFDKAAQQKLLVYNVPQYTGIDIISGHASTFIGDTALTNAGFLKNFHLLPSRIFGQFDPSDNLLLQTKTNTSFEWGGKKITVLRTQLDYKKSKPISTDILLVSGNPPGNPARILPLIKCSQIVLDGSNSAGRIARWQHAADSLHLRLHSVSLQGAFVMEKGRQQQGPLIN